MKPLKPIRCAIYTRVSTDQGLDQEFNSLDAQREASEAYIKSQAHEGWVCLKQVYDDGGYSGGSMERPALQTLLNDIRDKKLDVIVVYKVDRLTRSLADFAKLVELFDAHNVSFVSVTQSFNTTSSMGRLTLNVLLSFAQFEREVTGERIRDKFAASKKKGMWMGGVVPYGYRLEKRKLLIDPPEADKVRQIFQLYLELKSLPKLAEKLAALGFMSSTRKFGEGRTIGGQPFRTGALSHMLTNRVYIGEVRHHKQHFTGEHDPILNRALFDAIQTELSQRLNRKTNSSRNNDAPLKGLLFDSNGNRMVHAYANKAGVRHRYYQSWVLAQGQKEKAGAVSRVPAQEIEQIVQTALQKYIAGNQLDSEGQADDQTDWLQMIQRVDVLENALTVHLKVEDEQRNSDDQSNESTTITIPWAKPSLNRRRQIIGQTELQQSHRPMRAETRSRLLSGIAQGRVWLDQLLTDKAQSVAAIAAKHGLSERSVHSKLSLAFLAPDIIEATIEGRLPRRLTATQFTDLPMDWNEQRKALELT